MPSTGVNLLNQWFDDPNLTPHWWVISLPVYYCHQPDKTLNVSMNFATGSTWLGPTMLSAGSTYAGRPTGLKYAYTLGLSGTTSDDLGLKWYNTGSGGYSLLKPLNTGSTGPYVNAAKEWDRPGSYQVGLAKDPLFFGPYCLSKTGIASAPIPTKDGDILLIQPGTDVLGGSNSGDEGSEDDSRVYNMLFYSTGSDEALAFLENQIGWLAPDYSYSSRRGEWAASIENSSAMLFFAVSASAQGPSSLTWWPANYADPNTDPTGFYALIDANNAS